MSVLQGEYVDGESTAYTAVSLDGAGYDETNGQLLLKVAGADTVIPFKREIISGLTGSGTIVGQYESYSTSSDRYDWQKTFTYTATEDCFVAIFSVGTGYRQSTNTTSVSNGAKTLWAKAIYPTGGTSYYTTAYCALVYCPKGSTVSHYFYCLNYSHGGYCYLCKLN